jgi:O-antigen/teichoic acid export membrane protein
VASWSIYALQDSALAGLRQSIWVPVENSIGALLKILLLLILPALLPLQGIFAAWLLPVLLSNLPVNYLIFWRLIPDHVKRAHIVATPSATTISRYVLGNYVGTLCYLGYTTLLPILVTTLVGPSANAYFYMAWMLAVALQLIAYNLTTSLTVEGGWEEAKFQHNCRHVLKQAILLVTPLVVLCLIGAPLLLRLFGVDYAREGAPLLRLLALSTLPNIIVLLHLSIARVRNQTYSVIWAQGTLCALLVGLSYVLLPRLGIVGVGWAALVAQSTVAGLALMTDMRTFIKQSWHLVPVHAERRRS